MQDVDSAAKFIGAGAATVGVAGQLFFLWFNVLHKNSKFSRRTGLLLLGTPANLSINVTFQCKKIDLNLDYLDSLGLE